MRPTLRRIAGSLSVAALLAVSVAVPAGAASPAGPGRQLALGVSMQPYTSLSVLDQFTADTGRAPAIWSVWSTWGGASRDFPASLVGQLHTRGITPMVIWEPANPTNEYDGGYTYRKIINGRRDAYIRDWAQKAKDEGGTILLRFAHEMNGSWFPWSTNRFDNTPRRFQLAWRHIWNIFRGPGGVGATNVKFLWSPIPPCPSCSSVAGVYPGQAYVDYVGFSSFNWSTPFLPWHSMVETFARGMKMLMALTTRPIIVAETGSSYEGGNKSVWLTRGYPAVYAKWPQLRAIVYFNINTLGTQGVSRKRNWRLTTPNADPLLAYKAVLTDVRFQGSIN